ncbi:hypothetical protein C8T65DRAFT_537151, partial [Cerioporus squamosus]
DPAFALLPPTLKRSIDDAFDSAAAPHKRHKPAQVVNSLPGGFLADDVPAGGFIPDDPTPGGFSPDAGGFVADTQAGGFLREGSTTSAIDEESSPPTHIPLSSIPTALQILDLQPDDEDVLAVFQNAATGWGDRAHAHGLAEGSQDAFVSRKDWRAVCAALLGSGPLTDAEAPTSDNHALAENVVEAFEDLSDLTADSVEEYVNSGGTESDSDDSDDEYQEGGFVPTKRRSGAAASQTRSSKFTKGRPSRTRKSSSASSEGGDEGRHARLTAHQKKECRTAFALFFPDVPDKDLDCQRIRIKDITRVAQLLKEKLSTEETVEMLEAFSTAPDKSMGLADFERMMVATKMA